MVSKTHFSNDLDINECERKTDECHKKANCTNLIGSYSCACPSGLRGDGKHLCTGICIAIKALIVSNVFSWWPIFLSLVNF